LPDKKIGKDLGYFYSHLNYALLVFLILNVLLPVVNLINGVDAQNLSSSISVKANAGEDQYVEEGQPVILNAEDSLSSKPPIDKYMWRQVEPNNPVIDLENADTSRASFTAPNLPEGQHFIFQLLVKDENITDVDTVTIFVVEDLSSIESSKGPGLTYEPEICYDGWDNDLDGLIDIQDPECGSPTGFPPSYSQIPPVSPQHPSQPQFPMQGESSRIPNLEERFPQLEGRTR
jgi:hypothetical protein